MGRVDGLIPQRYWPLNGVTMVVLRVSGKVRTAPSVPFWSITGEVSVVNDFFRRSTVPGGALPVRVECRAEAAVFSSALK
jgi:hypothetical protein